MIIGTCGDGQMVWDLEIAKVFDIRIMVEKLDNKDELEKVLINKNVSCAKELSS